MPNISDATDSVAELIQTTFGTPPPPPPPPSAPPTLGGAPVVSSTPGPGQIPKVDAGGVLQAKVGHLSVLTADPANPSIGTFWYRSDTSQFCIRHDAATTKRVTLA